MPSPPTTTTASGASRVTRARRVPLERRGVALLDPLHGVAGVGEAALGRLGEAPGARPPPAAGFAAMRSRFATCRVCQGWTPAVRRPGVPSAPTQQRAKETAAMRAIVYRAAGGPEVLGLESDRPVPEPGAGRGAGAHRGVRREPDGLEEPVGHGSGRRAGAEPGRRRHRRRGRRPARPSRSATASGCGTPPTSGRTAPRRSSSCCRRGRSSPLPDDASFDLGASLGIPALTAHLALTAAGRPGRAARPRHPRRPHRAGRGRRGRGRPRGDRARRLVRRPRDHHGLVATRRRRSRRPPARTR